MFDDERTWEKEILSIEPLKKSGKTQTQSNAIIKKTPIKEHYFFPVFLSAKSTFITQHVDTYYFEKKKIHSKLDLHGLTKIQAMDRLLSFLNIAQLQNYKTVIIITGKGKESSVDNSGFGILRTSTIEWFKSNPTHVVAYAVCKPQDSGSGAFYVHVRSIK